MKYAFSPTSVGTFSMGRLLRCGAAFLAVIAWTGAVAQTPQVTITRGGADSIPQTTVVPVQQQPTRLTARTTSYEESGQDLDRVERRALRAKEFAARIDSLVQSRDYLFFPNSMQEIPGGLIRSVYADFFFLGVFVDHVEVHLPTERGITQYVEILNFDSMSVRNYQAARLQWGWAISFNVTDGDDTYHINFEISTTTGETVLTFITPMQEMRYVGWLWNKRMPKAGS